MRLEGAFDLPGTLQGGQAFRWRRKPDGAFVAPVGERLVRIAPTEGGIDARASPRAPRAFFERYLRLEAEDAARRRRLQDDSILAPAVGAMPGLRLLRQDPWETTVAFLVSANNNVLRIEGILERLAERWGQTRDGPDDPAWHTETYRPFPTPERLARASETALRGVGLGYRAPFLRETARMIARGDVDLDALRGATHGEIRAQLLELPGVGPKVADCIALMSLDADEAFPIDRWVLRAVSDTFFDGRPIAAREAATFAAERWGRDAGLAQQYLFHAARLREGAPGTRRLTA